MWLRNWGIISLDICRNTRQNKEQEIHIALMASQSSRAAVLWSVSASVSALHATPYITNLCTIWAIKEGEGKGDAGWNQTSLLVADTAAVPCSSDGRGSNFQHTLARSQSTVTRFWNRDKNNWRSFQLPHLVRNVCDASKHRKDDMNRKENSPGKRRGHACYQCCTITRLHLSFHETIIYQVPYIYP